MSYDERIAARIRAVLAKRRDVVERKMFGGLTFMVNGAMCCGITSEALVVRVGPAEYERALAEPHARPMDFTGRPLVGMVYVDPPGYRTAPALSRWIQRGIDFVTGANVSASSRTRTPRRRSR
jgi:TfoX/Sxy family transcriptional regulator of competence genes